MASASARAPEPNKRKGRAVAAARPLLNLHQLSTTTDNTAALRLQRLLDMGVAASRAALLAGMAWEVNCG